MVSTLSQAEKFLLSFAQSNWPEAAFAAKFRPLLDLGFGDLTTQLPLEMARLTRRRADECGKELLAAWPMSGHGCASLDGDFLNLRVLLGWDDFGQLLAQESKPEIGALSLFVPPLTDWAKLGGQVRLLARVALHVRLFQCEARRATLKLVGGVPESLRAFSLAKIFRELVSHCLAGGPQAPMAVEGELAAFVRNNTLPTRVIYLLPALIDATRLRNIFPRGEHEAGCELCFAAKRWVDWSIGERAVRELLQWSDSDLISLIWYLAEDGSAHDIDLFIPKSAEKANLVWDLQRSLERVSRLQVSQALGVDPSFAELYRRIAQRVGLFQRFKEEATWRGQIGTFVGVLRDLSMSFNSLCNKPEFRMRLDRGQIGPGEGKILTGVQHLLSAIISESGLFSIA